jgi:hypothetical protein
MALLAQVFQISNKEYKTRILLKMKKGNKKIEELLL